jgi:hypothetical protein
LVNSSLSIINKNKFSVVILICIWFLSSNNSIFAGQAFEEQKATMTTVNSTSFKVFATNSSATPLTNMHMLKLTSVPSKSGATPLTNMHEHELTSFSFNVLATTSVAKLPQTLLPSYIVKNASDTFSESILSANNTLNNHVSYFQQSLSRTIHGTIHSPVSDGVN